VCIAPDQRKRIKLGVARTGARQLLAASVYVACKMPCQEAQTRGRVRNQVLQLRGLITVECLVLVVRVRKKPVTPAAGIDTWTADGIARSGWQEATYSSYGD
jgi:hypothetical protein